MIILDAVRAFSLMTSPVHTVPLRESMHAVARLFVDRDVGSVVVVDDFNRAVGVVTKSDLARYDRERAGMALVFEEGPLVTARTHERFAGKSGYHMEPEEESLEGWMTPRVYCVDPESALPEIVGEMTRRHIHHVFVRGKVSGKIEGVITSLDVAEFLWSALSGQERPRRWKPVAGGASGGK